MQYMALIYSDPAGHPAQGSPQSQQMLVDYMAFTKRLKDDGAFVAGDALLPVQTATTVRVRRGKTETMDGPFAETKETLGGYYLMECRDLDQALAYAAMIPGAAVGSVEVRPVMVYS